MQRDSEQGSDRPKKHATRHTIVVPVVTALLSSFLLNACSGSANQSSWSAPGLVRTLTGHTFWVESVGWSSDGKLLASGGDDATVRIWDPASGKLLQTLDDSRGIGGLVVTLAWAPDGKYLATGSPYKPDVQMELWDTSTWTVVGSWSSIATAVDALSWTADGRRLAISAAWLVDPTGKTSNGDSSLVIYDLVARKPVAELTDANKVYSGVWDPGGTQIAFIDLVDKGATTGHQINRLLIWDVSQGGGSVSPQNTRIVSDHLVQDIGAVVAWSPQGEYLATTGPDNTLLLWDTKTWQEVASFPSKTNIAHIAWSPNGKYVAGSSERAAIVWDVSARQEVADFPHPDVLAGIAWSPDSKLLATACADHNVRIWAVK